MNRFISFTFMMSILIGSVTAHAQEIGSLYSGRRIQGGLVPEHHVVRRGDTLWDITGYYFNNPWDWPRVWGMNPEISNPHWIYPNDRVRLRDETTTEGQPSRQSSGLSVVHRGSESYTGPITIRNVAYLDQDALEQSGTIVGSPLERMMFSEFDEVYVTFINEQYTPRVGAELTIYRDVPENERDPSEQGELVRIQGTLVIREWDRDRRIAHAQVTEALEPIERGYRIAPIERRMDVVAPRENDRDVEAHVIATSQAREMLAEHQLVFLDVGENNGVRLGNRFQIVRQEDPYRSTRVADVDRGEMIPNAPRPSEYPPEVIAEGRVVQVRPRTTLILLTRSIVEVRYGDRAEMHRGY